MAQHSCYWFATCPTQNVVMAGLVRNADILIIGGGIAGISLLYQLVNSGFTNTYLVEESSVGFHASGRGSGQLLLRGAKLFSQMPEEDGKEYLEFISENNRRFLTGLRNVKFDTDLRDTGGLRLAVSEEEMTNLIKESFFINKYRGLECPILSQQDIQNILPNSPFVGGIFIPTESMFNPYKLVNGLRELLERKGPRVLTDCQVTSVDKVSDGFSVSIRHKGTIKAKKVVYCNNAYTPELLPELADVITSFRGQMIATDFLPNSVLQTLPQMSITSNDCNEYFRPHGGRLLVGGMRHSVRGNQIGIVDDGEFSVSVYERLRAFAVSAIPAIKDIKFTHSWSNVLCSTPDGLPLIGKVPNKENEFVLGGFGYYGYSHILHGSMIIKDLISKGESQHPGVRLFDPKRFSNV